MKMMEDQRTGSAEKTGSELSIKLVPLSEKDDIKSYLVTFERIMIAHKIDRRTSRMGQLWPDVWGQGRDDRKGKREDLLPTGVTLNVLMP